MCQADEQALLPRMLNRTYDDIDLPDPVWTTEASW